MLLPLQSTDHGLSGTERHGWQTVRECWLWVECMLLIATRCKNMRSTDLFGEGVCVAAGASPLEDGATHAQILLVHLRGCIVLKLELALVVGAGVSSSLGRISCADRSVFDAVELLC